MKHIRIALLAAVGLIAGVLASRDTSARGVKAKTYLSDVGLRTNPGTVSLAEWRIE